MSLAAKSISNVRWAKFLLIAYYLVGIVVGLCMNSVALYSGSPCERPWAPPAPSRRSA